MWLENVFLWLGKTLRVQFCRTFTIHQQNKWIPRYISFSWHEKDDLHRKEFHGNTSSTLSQILPPLSAFLFFLFCLRKRTCFSPRIIERRYPGNGFYFMIIFTPWIEIRFNSSFFLFFLFLLKKLPFLKSNLEQFLTAEFFYKTQFSRKNSVFFFQETIIKRNIWFMEKFWYWINENQFLYKKYRTKILSKGRE